jgi:hypothetical protein
MINNFLLSGQADKFYVVIRVVFGEYHICGFFKREFFCLVDVFSGYGDRFA